jgi:hypothetical protein
MVITGFFERTFVLSVQQAGFNKMSPSSRYAQERKSLLLPDDLLNSPEEIPLQRLCF